MMKKISNLLKRNPDYYKLLCVGIIIGEIIILLVLLIYKLLC